MAKSVLSLFSSRSFMVFILTFRFLNHFEFIVLFGVRGYSNLIGSCPVFPAPLVEEVVFSPLYILAFFVLD